MATISNQYINLSKIENAILSINELPEVSFFISSFNIPGINLGTRPVANPFKEHQEPGNLLTFEELQLSLIVDEEFTSWNTINEWIREGSNGYTFNTKNITKRSGVILITTNNLNPKYKITIQDMFPISISSIDIDIQQTEPLPLTFTATFQYSLYNFGTV